MNLRLATKVIAAGASVAGLVVTLCASGASRLPLRSSDSLEFTPAQSLLSSATGKLPGQLATEGSKSKSGSKGLGRKHVPLGRSQAPKSPDFYGVELLTPSVEAQISSRAGTYSVESAVRLRVTSSKPGWHMTAKATNLKLDGEISKDMVPASEVCLVSQSDEFLPLHQPRTVVEFGVPGETNIEVNLSLVTTEFHRLGSYKGWLLVESQKPTAPTSQLIKIPFEVDVNCRVDHSIDGNKIYFHFGDPTKNLTGVVRGHLTADARLYLTLLAPNGRIHCLPQTRVFSGEKGSPDYSIPVIWKLSEGASGGLRGPDTESSDGGEVSWLLEGTPGHVEYRLECTVAPMAYQAPGDYGMQVVLMLEPIL